MDNFSNHYHYNKITAALLENRNVHVLLIELKKIVSVSFTSQQ